MEQSEARRQKRSARNGTTPIFISSVVFRTLNEIMAIFSFQPSRVWGRGKSSDSRSPLSPKLSRNSACFGEPPTVRLKRSSRLVGAGPDLALISVD